MRRLKLYLASKLKELISHKRVCMKISVYQILNSESAIFHDEGLRVYAKFDHQLALSQTIELSFESISTCSTQFLNACIGKAYLTCPKLAEKHLKVVDFDQMPLFKSKLDDVIENALNYTDVEPLIHKALA